MRNRIREFLMLGSLAAVASVVGAGAAVYGASRAGRGGGGGGGGGSVPGASTYVPEWQQGADHQWQQLLQSMSQSANNDAAWLTPYLQDAFRSNVGRNAVAMPMMDEYSRTIRDQGNAAYTAANGLRERGDAIWEQGADPRDALYNRNLGRTQQQSRTATNLRGIGMSPNAAGLENQAVGNFNLDWENAQLGRMLAAGQGMGGLYDEAGRYQQFGNASLVGSADMYNRASQLPWGPANNYASGMAAGVYNPWNAIQGNLGSYMGLGQSGSNAAFGQGQTNLNNLTTGLQQGASWLQNFFGNSTGGGGGNNITYEGSTWDPGSYNSSNYG